MPDLMGVDLPIVTRTAREDLRRCVGHTQHRWLRWFIRFIAQLQCLVSLQRVSLR